MNATDDELRIRRVPLALPVRRHSQTPTQEALAEPVAHVLIGLLSVARLRNQFFDWLAFVEDRQRSTRVVVEDVPVIDAEGVIHRRKNTTD